MNKNHLFAIIVAIIVVTIILVVSFSRKNEEIDTNQIKLTQAEKQIVDYFVENREKFEIVYNYLLIHEGSFNKSGEYISSTNTAWNKEHIEVVSDCVKFIYSITENEDYSWLNDIFIGSIMRDEINSIEFSFTMNDSGQIFIVNKNNTYFSSNLNVIADDWCYTSLYPT